jgi:sulfite oxidase
MPGPSDNYFQTRAYKLFAPQVHAESADWDTSLALGELPVNSVIGVPERGARLAAGRITVRGYAIAGGERTVARVDISCDGELTWREAAWAGGPPRRGMWRLWRTQVDLAPGAYTLVARAIDSAAQTRPEDWRHVWNFKGYCNTAWHRVPVTVE